jgi:hypothetical protein
MSERDIEWLARHVHATGGTSDRLVVNPANMHALPEVDIQLADSVQAYNFCLGVEYVFEHGRLLRGWRLAWWRVRQVARRWTRWWRLRTVCSAVDQERGVVTMAQEHWSWRRWRWERR